MLEGIRIISLFLVHVADIQQQSCGEGMSGPQAFLPDLLGTLEVFDGARVLLLFPRNGPEILQWDSDIGMLWSILLLCELQRSQRQRLGAVVVALIQVDVSQVVA